MTAALLPVLVGGGQTIDQPKDPTTGNEPLALMEDATRRAAADAGAGTHLLAAVDTIAVTNIVCYDYGDAGALLAERIGAHPSRTIYTTLGGNSPQSLVNHLCDEIAAGRIEVALIASAEAWHTMRALGRAGVAPPWTRPRDTDAPRWGDARPGSSELEIRHGAAQPIAVYPLFENAFRYARGLTLAAHQRELAEFCAGFAAIAAKNPYAWFRDGKSAATIGTVTHENRMIGFPYPKFMNSILEVNQAAALILTSTAAAARLGIAADRWVYPWAGVDVHEPWYVLERVDYHSLPSVQRGGASLLEAAGTSPDRISHLDLYSCFPIAPRLSAAALGIAPTAARPLTVTGGLPWFGGPGNGYTTHALATLIERLRTERDGFALAHALGWHMTKHALGVYAGRPPTEGWRRAGGSSLQAWVDALPRPALAPEATGNATIETYTIMHGRDGDPERGTVIGRLEDGRRFISVLPGDRQLLGGMEQGEQIGRRGRVRHLDGHNVFEPA